MIPKSKTWILAAFGGILAGCGAVEAPPSVPGAPAVDPAGVPTAAGEKVQRGEKHACASDGGCGSMHETPKPPGR